MTENLETKNFSIKRIWKVSIIVAVVLGILIATCPSRQHHCDSIVKIMSEMLQKQVKTLRSEYKAIFKEVMPDEDSQHLNDVAQSLIDMVEPAIDLILVVKNYGIFNVGYFVDETNGRDRVSIGFLGMVFTKKSEFKSDYSMKASEIE